MAFNGLNKDIARLILLQRIELASPFLSKIRKSFGRYLFTNFITKFFVSPKSINKKYYSIMKNEFSELKKKIDFSNKKILSIGSGMCGLELVINSKNKNNKFTIIEKNYVSKKVRYGWDEKNIEGYNNLNLLKKFMLKNGMKNNFKIYDFDRDNLPFGKFDLIISLYSLDYHYDFKIYLNFFKKVVNKDTIFIFDTIRPQFFRLLFENVEIISSSQKEIHSSKRIICKKFIN
jgi:hypothetical protein